MAPLHPQPITDTNAPNGMVADSLITVLAHEIAEIVTNPVSNAPRNGVTSSSNLYGGWCVSPHLGPELCRRAASRVELFRAGLVGPPRQESPSSMARRYQYGVDGHVGEISDRCACTRFWL